MNGVDLPKMEEDEDTTGGRGRGSRNNKWPLEKRQATANKERRRRLHPHSKGAHFSSAIISPLLSSSLAGLPDCRTGLDQHAHTPAACSLSSPSSLQIDDEGDQEPFVWLRHHKQTPPRPNHRAPAFFNRAPTVDAESSLATLASAGIDTHHHHHRGAIYTASPCHCHFPSPPTTSHPCPDTERPNLALPCSVQR
jgi:hypothetical protein